MANMRIGTLTLASYPSGMTVLIQDKHFVDIQTITDVAVYDWGKSWAGKPITLKWDIMLATDFDSLDLLLADTGTKEFDPQDGKAKTYDVYLKRLTGEYWLDLTSGASVFRKGVELLMIIKEQN